MMSEAIEGSRDGTSEANRIENRESDRRRHFRFPFTASVEAIEPLSQARLKGRVSDLGFGGCYVDTMNPFAVGTLIKISLTKEKATFETDAKVIFSHVGMGMGVEFASTLPQQLRVLHNWLTELAGKTSPEQEPMKGTEADGVANTLENQDFVVDELHSSHKKGRVERCRRQRITSKALPVRDQPMIASGRLRVFREDKKFSQGDIEKKAGLIPPF